MAPLAKLLARTALLAAIVVGSFAVPAHAATSFTYAPTTITGIPTSGQKVQHLGTIDLAMAAGQTAYVTSTMRAYQASHVTLIDNEVMCSGVGGGNVVMGENIDPPTTSNVDRHDITILARFLVTATSAGTLTCRVYYRGASLAPVPSSVTVRGELRFTETSVGEDANGSAMQTSLPSGHTIVSSTVRTPVLDRTVAPGTSSVTVFAEMEYMSCWPVACEDSWTRSDARFTLFVNQMNGSTVCASAPSVVVNASVTRQTHHKAIPLETTHTLVPGCTRIYAYVKAEYVSGRTGAIQGRADGLSNPTGTGKHNSVMTHIFAIPR